MIPSQTFIEFPEFCNTGTKTKPDSAKYSAGFVEADVLPAEWLNYFENKSSVGITDLNRGVSSMQAEMNNVLDAAGKTPAESDSSQLVASIKYLIAQAKAEAILAAHPVGSLYWTESAENPNTTFGGGTWVQIKDKFILAAGDTYTNGATGGSATVTLTVANLPSHSHTYTPSGSVSVASHSHGLNSHTHTFTPSGTITMNAHRHGLNNHTHSFSWSGTTSDMSGTTSATWKMTGNRNGAASTNRITYEGVVDSNSASWSNHDNIQYTIDLSHTHTYSGSGTTGGNSGNTTSVTPTGSFTGTSSSTGGASGNTASTAPTASFSGTQSSTLNTGSNTAFSILPPYAVRYCWQRTA